MNIDNPHDPADLLVDDGNHAILGASGYERWANCPGSVVLTHGLPSTTSVYAEQGTAAHSLAESCLLQDIDANEFLGRTINGFEVDDEMVDGVQTYLDFCREIPSYYRQVEMKVSYSTYVPGGYGTVDFVAIWEDTLYICDFKYGRGVWVDAKENGQLMLYALGVYLAEHLFWDLKYVVLTICQPRMDNISQWTCSVDDLREFAEETQRRADLVFEKSVALVPGEAQCRFCGAESRCPALYAQMAEHLTEEFDDLDAVPLIDNDTLAECILPYLDQWSRAIEHYRQLARSLLEAGEKVGDYKRVPGRRGARAWLDPDTAADYLKEHYNEDCNQPRKLMSPTQVIKLLGLKPKNEDHKIFCDRLTRQPDGTPIVVPGDDHREALAPVVDDFAEEPLP